MGGQSLSKPFAVYIITSFLNKKNYQPTLRIQIKLPRKKNTKKIIMVYLDLL